MKFNHWFHFAPIFWRCIRKLPLRHLWYMAKLLRNENPQTHNGRTHINSFFPPHPSPAFNRFLDAVICRRRLPYSVYFAVTGQCPYHCSHCSYGKRTPDSMDTQQALAVIEQIKSIGAVTIGFTGGEPLLRDDLLQLIESAAGDTATVLFTTGYHLTLPLARSLRSVGLGCITIGIESDEPLAHDAIRGVPGSFNTAMRAIHMSLDAGLFTAISTMATHEKIQNGTLEKLAQMAHKIGVHEFRILEPVPTGDYISQADAVLTDMESRQIAQLHQQWNRLGKTPAIAAFSHLESDDLFGCGAGFHHLFVDAAGNVCPCDLTPLSFGNVRQEPLSTIWTKMESSFGLPRCGCLMKQICRQTDILRHSRELPLPPQLSEQICRQIIGTSKLPKAFAELFKDRIATNPPANQP